VMFAALWLFALRRSIRPPPKATWGNAALICA